MTGGTLVPRQIGRINGGSFGIDEGLGTGVARLDASLPVGRLAGITGSDHAESAGRGVRRTGVRNEGTGEELRRTVLHGSAVGSTVLRLGSRSGGDGNGKRTGRRSGSLRGSSRASRNAGRSEEGVGSEAKLGNVEAFGGIEDDAEAYRTVTGERLGINEGKASDGTEFGGRSFDELDVRGGRNLAVFKIDGLVFVSGGTRKESAVEIYGAGKRSHLEVRSPEKRVEGTVFEGKGAGTARSYGLGRGTGKDVEAFELERAGRIEVPGFVDGSERNVMSSAAGSDDGTEGNGTGTGRIVETEKGRVGGRRGSAGNWAGVGRNRY